MRVEIAKTDEKRLSSLSIFKGKRLDLKLNYEWETDGLLRAFDISGSRVNQITYDQILAFTNGRFIDNILNIANIENIENIETIELIKLITSISGIDLIKTIRSAYIEGIGNIIRNPKFDDTTQGWTVSNGTIIDEGFYVDHSLRLGNGADAASAYQYLPPFLGLILEGGLWHRSNTADLAIGSVYVSYTDGTNTSFTLNGTSNTWAFLNITGLTSTKKVKYILVLINAPYIVDVTNFNIYPHFASESTLAALSAKITNPLPVSLASIPNPSNLDIALSLLAREATLSALNAKVTACNTGAVTIAANAALIASNVALGLGENATYGTIRVDTATSGQATLLAAQGAGLKIYVCGYQLQAQGDVMVSLRSAASDISPEWDLNAREGVICPVVPKPLSYCNTVANELLSINLDAAIRVTGNVQAWVGA